AATRFARQHRTNTHALHARTLNLGREIFVDLLVGSDDDGTFNRIGDVVESRAADDAVAQRLDFLAAFDDRAGGDAPQRAAIVFADDHVLGHIDQSPGQITRIRGF